MFFLFKLSQSPSYIVQWASLGSATFVIYPEIKATEVTSSSLKTRLPMQLLFQDNKMQLVESKETHCTIKYRTTAVCVLTRALRNQNCCNRCQKLKTCYIQGFSTSKTPAETEMEASWKRITIQRIQLSISFLTRVKVGNCNTDDKSRIRTSCISQRHKGLNSRLDRRTDMQRTQTSSQLGISR